MAEKAGKFVNLEEIEVAIKNLKGTVKIPIILEDQDLDLYLKKSLDLPDKFKEAENEKSDKPFYANIQMQMETRKHLVKEVDFPGLTIDDFREDRRPFPALSQQIVPQLKALIDQALNLPNS